MYNLAISPSKNCVQPTGFFRSIFAAEMSVGNTPYLSFTYRQVIHTPVHCFLDKFHLLRARYTLRPHSLLLQLLINLKRKVDKNGSSSHPGKPEQSIE